MATDDSRADLALRLLLTAVSFAGFLALRHTPLPYASRVLAEAGVDDASTVVNLSLGAIGVVPFTTAAGLVEVSAVVLPALRRRRLEGPSARRALDRFAIALGFVFVIVQAGSVCVWLRSIDLFETSELAVLGVTLAVVTIALYGLARFVDRTGVGSGVFGFFALAQLEDGLLHVFDARAALARAAASPSGRELLFPLAVGIGAWLVLLIPNARRNLFRDVGADLAMPTSGVLPLAIASFVVTVGLQRAPAIVDLVTRGVIHGMVPTLVLAFGFSLALGALFVPRASFLRVSAHAGIDVDEASRLRRRAILWSAVLLVVAAASTSYASDRRTDLELAALLGALPHVLAWLLDLGGELRFTFTHASVAAAAELHAPFALTGIRAVLEDAGVPHFVRSASARSVLQILAPYAPLVVLVPAADLARARAAIGPILAALVHEGAEPLEDEALVRVFE